MDLDRARDHSLRQLGVRPTDTRPRSGAGRRDGPADGRPLTARREGAYVPSLGLGSIAVAARSRVRLCHARGWQQAPSDGDPPRSSSRTAKRTPRQAGAFRNASVLSEVRRGRYGDPRGQHALRHGYACVLRPPRRGQDRDDRPPRRRLVRWVHASAPDHGLDRLRGEIDGERAGSAWQAAPSRPRSGAGSWSAPLLGCPSGFPEPQQWPVWHPFQRGPYALGYDPYAAPTAEEKEPRQSRRAGNGQGKPPGKGRVSARRRLSSPLPEAPHPHSCCGREPAAAALATGAAVLVVVALRSGSPGPSRRRWFPSGRQVRRLRCLGARAAVDRLRALCGGARPPPRRGRAAIPQDRRAGGGDSARAALRRYSSRPMPGRIGSTADRRGGGGGSVRPAAQRLPEQSALSGWVGPGATRPPSTARLHAGVRSRSPGPPGTRPTLPPWTFKALAAAAGLAAAFLAAGWHGAGSSRSPSRAGIRSSPHLAGGGHNDAWLAALLLAALALGLSVPPRRSLAGAAWALAIAVKWVPVVFLALVAITRGPSRPAVGVRGFAVTAVIVALLATAQYGSTGQAAADAGGQRRAGDELRASRPGRATRCLRTRPLVLFAAGFVVGLALLARAARGGRLLLGRAALLVLLTTPYLAVWYLAWAFRWRRRTRIRGRRPGASCWLRTCCHRASRPERAFRFRCLRSCPVGHPGPPPTSSLSSDLQQWETRSYGLRR